MARSRRKRCRCLSATFVDLRGVDSTAFDGGELTWALVAFPDFLRGCTEWFVGGLLQGPAHMIKRAPAATPPRYSLGGEEAGGRNQ